MLQRAEWRSAFTRRRLFYIVAKELGRSVVTDPGIDVLEEAVRQGSEILADQRESIEAIQRRGSELLRLAVATLGGVIVVSGILSTRAVHMDLVVFLVLTCAVFLLVASAGTFAFMLAGGKNRSGFASGPDLHVLGSAVVGEGISKHDLLASILKAQPGWVDGNEILMDRMQTAAAFGLGGLALGVVLFLAPLIYIMGGAIHG